MHLGRGTEGGFIDQKRKETKKPKNLSSLQSYKGKRIEVLDTLIVF